MNAGRVGQSPARRRRRLLLCALLSVVISVVGGTLALCYQAAYTSVHPHRRPLIITPASLRLGYENITFPATDGLKIRGWFIPAQHSRGVIICCHGYPGIRSDQLEFVGFLHRAHFGTLLFDFRALGQSEGNYSTLGYLEVKDALGAVAYLHRRRDTQHLPLGIFGVSMGAAVALMATEQSPSIQAVVADSPYSSLDHAIAQRFRRAGSLGVVLAYPTRWFGERMTGIHTSDIAPLRAIRRISPRPLLLIHGAQDKTIPPGDSRLLFAAANQPKQLWIVPKAGHGQGHRKAKGTYENKVINFFTRALSHQLR